jgi:ubiquinone/menaquinone biosynthesis C-methylase UbiE
MTHGSHSGPGTRGHVLHWAAGYDILAFLMLFGRERSFRERLLGLARIRTGESVLDIGCGTGSLAIAARRRVGPSGTVEGIDPSPEMVARATKKARKAGLDATFTRGVAESLPFPAARFDLVMNTLMLHHLPPEDRAACAREIRRVLKPGGRALLVDFAGGSGKGLLARFHRHGGVTEGDVVSLMSEAGLRLLEKGPVGVRDLFFVLVTA